MTDDLSKIIKECEQESFDVTDERELYSLYDCRYDKQLWLQFCDKKEWIPFYGMYQILKRGREEYREMTTRDVGLAVYHTSIIGSLLYIISQIIR